MGPSIMTLTPSSASRPTMTKPRTHAQPLFKCSPKSSCLSLKQLGQPVEPRTKHQLAPRHLSPLGYFGASYPPPGALGICPHISTLDQKPSPPRLCSPYSNSFMLLTSTDPELIILVCTPDLFTLISCTPQCSTTTPGI